MGMSSPGRSSVAGAPGAGDRLRPLVVHIGLPKTASTTIQRALALFDPQLRERGIHVARAAWSTPGLARQDGLWFALRDPTRGAGVLSELQRELRQSTAERFVVSDERFGRAPLPHIVRGLADLAASAGVDIRIVAYVRPQCDYLESAYAERVRGGMERLSFDLFAAASLMHMLPGREFPLDYRRVFAPWRAVYGDRLLVFPFERSRLPDGPAAHFLSLLGIDDLDTWAVPRANTRVGAKNVEVRRLVVAALTARGPAPSRYALMTRLDGLDRLLPDDRLFAPLTVRQAADLMACFGPANAAFARDYGIDSGGHLFRDDPVPDGTLRPNLVHWPDFAPNERRAVREYVERVAGVDLEALSGSRFAAPHGYAPLARLRTRLPFASHRWRASWLADPVFLRHCAAALVTRLRR